MSIGNGNVLTAVDISVGDVGMCSSSPSLDAADSSTVLDVLRFFRGGLPPVECRAVRRFRFSPTCSGEAVG